MNFKYLLVTLLATSVAALKIITIAVLSNDTRVNNQNLQFLYEGRESNYAFLVNGVPPSFQYDSQSMTISLPNGNFQQILNIDNNNFVSVSPEKPAQKFTFVNTRLAVDNRTDCFYACKNTNDPKQYSEVIYELMYYTGNAPSDCIAVNLINNYVISVDPSNSTSHIESNTKSYSSSTSATVIIPNTLISSTSALTENHSANQSITASSYSTQSVSSISSLVPTGAANYNLPDPLAIGLFAGVAALLLE